MRRPSSNGASPYFLVDQAAQQQVLRAGIFRHFGGEAPVHRRRHFRQLTLSAHREFFGAVDPAHPGFGAHTPNFFLSQSTSIFNRPISPYRRSSSPLSSAGFGPRLPSNSAPADSRISFFHCPDQLWMHPV